MARGDRGTGVVTFDVIEIARGGHAARGDLHGPLLDETPAGWYWRVRATNGLTLAHSEVYERRGAAITAIRNVVAAIRGDAGTGVRLVVHELDGGAQESRL